MDQMPTPRRPRSHHRRGWRRAARRWLGLGRPHAALRLVLLLAAVLVAGTAAAVALRPGGPGVVAAGPPSPAPIATQVPPQAPQSTSSGLPVDPSSRPVPSALATPRGVVANRVRIDRLGIDLRIIEGDGIDAPMHRAAHYPGSGWPGGGTNIYLYAHAQEGMFLPLWDARVGDEVVLELADGTEASYVVTRVRPRVPWDEMEVTRPTPSERLSLQTSTSYTPTAPRFLVIAEPAP